MTIELTIPELGDSTTTGIVLSLLAEPGSKVSAGENLLEVETDKVVMEVPTEQGGILENFLVKQGDRVEMGSKFAQLAMNEIETVKEETKATGVYFCPSWE